MALMSRELNSFRSVENTSSLIFDASIFNSHVGLANVKKIYSYALLACL
jgi:hypothetical protein